MGWLCETVSQLNLICGQKWRMYSLTAALRLSNTLSAASCFFCMFNRTHTFREICKLCVRMCQSSLIADPSHYSSDISSVCWTVWRPGHVPGVSVSLRIECSIYSWVYYGIIMQCAVCGYVCVTWRGGEGKEEGIIHGWWGTAMCFQSQ